MSRRRRQPDPYWPMHLPLIAVIAIGIAVWFGAWAIEHMP